MNRDPSIFLIGYKIPGIPGIFSPSSARWIQDYIHKNKEYYLSPDEMFARAYAQYVALKSGDPEVLNELHSVLGGTNSWRYWSTSDWIPIENAINDALKRRTWL